MKKVWNVFFTGLFFWSGCFPGVPAQAEDPVPDFRRDGAVVENLFTGLKQTLRQITVKQKRNADWSREQQRIRGLAQSFARKKKTFLRMLMDLEQTLIERGASDRMLNRHRDFCDSFKVRMDRIEEKLVMEDYEGLGGLLPGRKIPCGERKINRRAVKNRRRGAPEYFSGKNSGAIVKPKRGEIKEKEINLFPGKKDKFGLYQKDGSFELVRFEPSSSGLRCDLRGAVVNEAVSVISKAVGFDLDLPLYAHPIHLAGLGSISGLLSRSTFNAITPPVPTDLAEDGIDIVFSDEIQSLADALKGDPIKIYQHVKNNYTYQPYPGSLKGARGALVEKSGNDVDLSSLMISLLRYSGYPARYGEALVTVDIDRAMNWLGFDDPAQVGFYLSTAGIKEVENLYSGSELKQVRFRHVYVEVYLPYGNYRGQLRDDSHSLWVPLSPSFKKYEHVPGHMVPFDMDAFLAGLEENATVDENGTLIDFKQSYINREIEKYADEIEDYLDTTDPDMTISEFYGQSVIDAPVLPILPITLPFVAEDKTSYSVLNGIDRHHRVKVQLSYHDMDLNVDEEEGGLGTQEIRWEKPIAEIYGKRLTLSYRPATEEDVQLLNEYDGNILGTPCYLIHMFPQLKLDGEIVAENVDNSTGPINNAEISMGLEETLRVEILKPGETHFPARRSDYQVTVGDHAAIVLGLGNITSNVLNESLETLESASNDETATLDDLLGQQLKLTGETWYFQADLFNSLIAKQAGVQWFRDPSDLCVFRHLDVGYTAGYFPTVINGSTIFIDAPGNRLQAVPKDSDWQKRVGFFRSAGMFGSILEHAVLTQLYRKDAISAAKLISLAVDNGTAIYEIHPDNRDLLVPMLDLPEEDIAIITRELDLGQTVIVPEARVTRNDYCGVGIISLTPDDDPMGAFRQGYFISRGGDGGQITTAIQSLLSEFVDPDFMDWIRFEDDIKDGVDEVVINSDRIREGKLPVRSDLNGASGRAMSVYMTQASASAMAVSVESSIYAMNSFFDDSRIIYIDFEGDNTCFPDQNNGERTVKYTVVDLMGNPVNNVVPAVTSGHPGFALVNVAATGTQGPLYGPGEGFFTFNMVDKDNLAVGEEIIVALSLQKPDGRFVNSCGTFVVGSLIDLDIDSNNNNGFEITVRTPEEDEIEDIEDDPFYPGKIVMVNDGDDDGDGILNYVDGIDVYGNEGTNAGGKFVPVVIEIHDSVDVNTAKIRFRYFASDPVLIIRSGTEESGYVFEPAPGSLRIWTKDGIESRLSASVGESGDFINSDTAYPVTMLGFDETQRKVVLYVEAIEASGNIADRKITVEIDPDGDDIFGYLGDEVNVTAVQIGWIDDYPDYSRLENEYTDNRYTDNGDSDNYFLRQKDACGNEDYKDLDIFYRLNLPEEMGVNSVKVYVYEEDSSNKIKFGDNDYLEGIKDENTFIKGESLHLVWPDVRDGSGQFRFVGFYRLQLEVRIEGLKDPIITSIEDGDEKLPGWQCPQNGLAIHDLIWKHRPDVYVGSGEVVAPGGPGYPFSSSVIVNYALMEDNLGGDDPVWEGTPEENYSEFGTFPVVEITDLYPVLQASVLNDPGDVDDHYIDMDDESRVCETDANLVCDNGLPYLLHRGYPHEHENHVFMHYWMYSISSHAPYTTGADRTSFAHEGDWEMVQLTVRHKNKEMPAKKSEWILPFAATASQHYYGQTLAWRLDYNKPSTVAGQRYVNTSEKGNRVKIYIAENAHATYFRDEDIDANISAGTGTQIQYDTDIDNYFDRIISPEEKQYKLLCLEDYVNDTGIFDWEGRWGEEAPNWLVPILRGPLYRNVNLILKYQISENPVDFHDECRKKIGWHKDILTELN